MVEREFGLEEIEKELESFPVIVSEQFRVARDILIGEWNESELIAWATHGLLMARQTVRSWEAAAEYFRVSTEVKSILPFQHLMLWAESGEALCKDSPAVSVAYFRASPICVGMLEISDVRNWSRLGGSLYKGTWKSSALATKFFDASGLLLVAVNYLELERLIGFVSLLSQRSYDMAQDCLTLSQEVFPLLGDNKNDFISLVMTMVNGSWRDVRECFETTARVLPRIEGGQRTHFLNLAEKLSADGERNVAQFLKESSNGLLQIDKELHATLLKFADTLLPIYPASVLEFLKSTPRLLDRISVEQLETWFTEGVALLNENYDGGMAFFRIQSTRSEELLDVLSSVVELNRVKDVLRMYCQALAGASMDIAPTTELVQKSIGWISKENPTTEGSTVYLPPVADQYNGKDENFGLFKVVATHQIAHLEFGSFEFNFNKPSSMFQDLRPRLAILQSMDDGLQHQDGQIQDDISHIEEGLITDMHLFFNLLNDRQLALDIFTVVEDGRLDTRVEHEYAGIRSHYRRVQQDSLSERPSMRTLPAREALIELLIRLSLRQEAELFIPSAYKDEARSIARVFSKVLSPSMTVEDSAEATIRIYAVISQIPNEEVPQDDWEDLDTSEEENEGTEDANSLMNLLEQQMKDSSEEGAEPSDEQSYSSPQDVGYRGDFKPELVQLLTKLKQSDGTSDQSTTELTKEMLEQILQQSAELEMDGDDGDITESAGAFANNLMRSAGLNVPPPGQGQGPLVHMDDDGGPLDISEPNAFLYDEWDFRADDYKPRWCLVREKPISEGDVSFWQQTLQANSGLIYQIRRQLEIVVPESFRKIRRLPEGEEFDLDATIEAVIDLRTTGDPSEKIYWRRNKIERDVASVFLLDMSASTAEAIDESKRADDWDAPDDPVEYMIWLRTRRSSTTRRSYKRIIDLEKESIVLMIQALEALGDQYGIYGFSGYGRENVEFYVIKDIRETFSDSIRRRIDKITPLHATRMGPAIRHASTKLDLVDAKTKLLFLISDGRPQDRGYSREGVEKEYAVHDTHKAFIEARRRDIVPFCLTVDKAGHDYLKAMCGDMGYEVLAEISSLPQRIPELYKSLTLT